jgi:hypothetical protein
MVVAGRLVVLEVEGERELGRWGWPGWGIWVLPPWGETLLLDLRFDPTRFLKRAFMEDMNVAGAQI